MENYLFQLEPYFNWPLLCLWVCDKVLEQNLDKEKMGCNTSKESVTAAEGENDQKQEDKETANDEAGQSSYHIILYVSHIKK